MSEAHNEIMQRYVEEAINKGNLAVLDELIHPDYVFRSPGEEVRGPEGFKGLIAAYRSAFPDLNMQIDDLLTEGNRTVTCFSLSGTHDGVFMGIAATGKQMKVNGMVLSRFEAGKVVAEWEILDQLAMFKQLGIVSLPA